MSKSKVDENKESIKKLEDERLKNKIEENDLADAFQKQREDQQEFRKRARSAAMAKEDEESSRASQELAKSSKKLLEWAIRELEHSAAGYENFSSVMNAQTPGLLLLGDMVYHANPIGSIFKQLNHPGNIVNYFTGIEFRSVTGFLGDQMGTVWDASGRTLGQLLGHRPEITTPDLQFFVDLNPDGTLAIHSLGENLRRSDGKPITKEQQGIFEAGVVAWILSANHQKYQLKKTPSGTYDVIDSTTKKKIDKDEFMRLRDDPDHGMQAFMERRFDLVFQALDEEPKDLEREPELDAVDPKPDEDESHSSRPGKN